MIVELDINGAKVIVSGENLVISVTDGDTTRRVAQRDHALTRYRNDNKLTLSGFGALVGAYKAMVYKWENGTIPRPAAMAKIKEVTGGKVTAADWYAGARA